MKDCVLTHNHPSGHKYDTNSILSIGSSFSYEDLETAIKGNLAEIRAITPHYVFSLKRPTTGWNEDILRQYTISADHIRNEYETLSINREDLFSMIFAHLIMKDLKKSFSLNYTKIKIT